QEAFKVAGDPNVFPDQGLPPWQPLKVYARSPFGRIDAQGMFDYATSQYVPAHFHNYVTGKVAETVPKANVVVPEGDTDPLLGGESYGQFGREGRILQRSQMTGGAGAGRGGRADVSYHRYGSHLKQPDGDDPGLESGFFDGIDVSLPGMATLVPEMADKFRTPLEQIDHQIAAAQHLFDAAHLDLTAPPLREALRSVDGFIHELENAYVNDLPAAESFNLLHELRIKRVQLNDALVLAHGMSVEATLADSSIAPGLLTTAQRIDVNTSFYTGNEPVELKSVQLHFLDAPVKTRALSSSPASADASSPRFPPGLPAGIHGQQTLRALVDKELPPTRPYFSRPNIEQPFYDISDPALRNAPATPAPLTVAVTFSDHGVDLNLTAIVADPSSSQPRQPAVVVPPVSVSLPVTAAVIPINRDTFPLSYSAYNPEAGAAPQFRLELPPLWSYTVPGAVNPAPPAPPAGRNSRQTAYVTTSDPSPYRSYPITVVTEVHGHEYREGYRSVGYAGLESTNYYTPTTFHVTAVDLTTAPSLNVAFLPGTGDDVPAALEDLYVHPHIITAADLTPQSLKQYDAVVLGVRAYESQPELAAANPALNAYAAGGGIVIAQYNTGRLPEGTGPYPLTLGGGEKVVEEDAPVHILAPAYPLLTWPNQITPSDFNNWVEERGHGFMESWDPRYTALLETHDHGQQVQAGGLLVGRTGKGAWIYLGLALYRQFSEGVPGPYRLFANLISAGKNQEFLATPPYRPVSK
ncbi:MAG: PIG-L family deacetylase, partial [Acidobacteriota bacterium]|nr:PIG-L family deacetylase [Acidobacteriota bacterium]